MIGRPSPRAPLPERRNRRLKSVRNRPNFGDAKMSRGAGGGFQRPPPIPPNEWNGSFYFPGPSSPLNTAIALYNYAPAYVTQAGGNITLAMTGGMITSDQERVLISDCIAHVIPYMMDPANWPATQAAIQQIPWGGWSPGCNQGTITANMLTGSGFNDIVTAMRGVGYPDIRIADNILLIFSDYFAQFGIPSGQTDAILATIFGAPVVTRWMDPVFFVDPATGIATLPDPTVPLADWMEQQSYPIAWVNHLGGEWVYLPEYFPSKYWQQVTSFINLCYDCWFSLDSIRIMLDLEQNDLDMYGSVLSWRTDYANWISTLDRTISYGVGDMVSPTPVSPTQKKYLQPSQWFNPRQEHPPTYIDSFIEAILLSSYPPLVPAGYTGTLGCTCAQSADPAKTATVCINNDFTAYVMQLFAMRIRDYEAAVPAGEPPRETSLLNPLAAYYGPTQG